MSTTPAPVRTRIALDAGSPAVLNLVGDGSEPPSVIAVPSAEGTDLLEAIGFALSSRLELGDVLGLLAQVARQVSASTRCSILLLEDDVLVPAASVAAERDEHLFEVFRSMDPLRASDVPELGALLDAGQPLAFGDARAGGPIPADWVSRFGLVAVALVPLRAAGQAAGLMALDHPTPGHFTPERVRLLASLGRYAGVAVRDARVHADAERRAALMTEVASCATELARTEEVGAVARALADAARRLTGGQRALLVLSDDGGTRARVIPATDCGTTCTVPVGTLPDCVRSALSADAPVVEATSGREDLTIGSVDGPVGRALVASLVLDGRPRGVLVAGMPPGRIAGQSETDAAKTLASIGSAALARALLLRRMDDQLWRLQVLGCAGTMLVDATSTAQLATGIDDLLARHGLEVVTLSLRQRRLRDLLGGPRPSPDERRAIDRGEPVVLGDGSVAIPLRTGRTVIGVLRLRTPGHLVDDGEFLDTLGRIVAELVQRAGMRTELDRAVRDRQLTADRDRLADEMRASMGRLLAAIGDTARAPVDATSPRSNWQRRLAQIADVAAHGASELIESDRAQAFLPSATRGTATAIRELCHSIESDSGIDIIVTASDGLDQIPTDVGWALFRVAHRGLTAAWKHGRAAVIFLDLETRRSQTTLRVRDDGVGLTQRQGMDTTLLAMRRTLAPVDGTVHVEAGSPHGLTVTAHVPVVAP